MYKKFAIFIININYLIIIFHILEKVLHDLKIYLEL